MLCTLGVCVTRELLLAAGCCSGMPSFFMAWFQVVPKMTWMTQRLLQPQNGFGFTNPEIPVCHNHAHQDGWCSRSHLRRCSLQGTVKHHFFVAGGEENKKFRRGKAGSVRGEIRIKERCERQPYGGEEARTGVCHPCSAVFSLPLASAGWVIAHRLP